MKRKRGLVHVILALLMSMLLIVSTGCGKSGSGDSSSDKKTDKTETLADVNTIPEDGVITKEQFKTVAGENKKVQFKGTTDDGITYIWTYDCSKIQNPADQNLKIDFSEKDLDDLKKQANNANDALKKANKAAEMSDDELKGNEEKVQKMTDKYVAQVDQEIETKTKEIMTV